MPIPAPAAELRLNRARVAYQISSSREMRPDPISSCERKSLVDGQNTIEVFDSATCIAPQPSVEHGCDYSRCGPDLTRRRGARRPFPHPDTPNRKGLESMEFL